jgi:hypothetical protein
MTRQSSRRSFFGWLAGLFALGGTAAVSAATANLLPGSEYARARRRLKWEVTFAEDAWWWSAEAIDHASEGECYKVNFFGPFAEEQAREYAAWMNKRT